MAKMPRSISGRDLVVFLSRYGYKVTRQKGSHVRLTSDLRGSEHKITIPNHQYIKIGTLNGIIGSVSDYLGIPKQRLIRELLDM